MSKNDARVWKKRYDDACARLSALKTVDEKLAALEEENEDLKDKNKRASGKLGAQTKKINKLEETQTELQDLLTARVEALHEAETENTKLRAVPERAQETLLDQQRAQADMQAEFDSLMTASNKHADEMRKANEEIGVLNGKLHKQSGVETEWARLHQFKRSITRDALKAYKGRHAWPKVFQRLFNFFDLLPYMPRVDMTPAPKVAGELEGGVPIMSENLGTPEMPADTEPTP